MQSNSGTSHDREVELTPRQKAQSKGKCKCDTLDEGTHVNHELAAHEYALVTSWLFISRLKAVINATFCVMFYNY